MKALLSKEVGGPETLVFDDLPDPVPGKGEVLVDTTACAINFPDTLVIRDLYQFKPPRPFAPGSEISGTIAALGDGVTGWQVGDRVIAMTLSGGLQQRIALPAAALFKVPDGINLTQASALLMTYATAIYALKDRAELKAGETVLVLGAAGGVGIATVELAKAFGARVVAAVSSEEKAASAHAAGADETVIYGRGPFDKDASKALAGQFKQACPQGADVIVDNVGGDYAEPALRSIAYRGRYLVIGFPAGIPKIPLNLTLLKTADIRGVFYGDFTFREPDKNRALVSELFDLWQEGKISPLVSETYPLERGGEAIAKLENRGAIGKLIVTMGD